MNIAVDREVLIMADRVHSSRGQRTGIAEDIQLSIDLAIDSFFSFLAALILALLSPVSSGVALCQRALGSLFILENEDVLRYQSWEYRGGEGDEASGGSSGGAPASRRRRGAPGRAQRGSLADKMPDSGRRNPLGLLVRPMELLGRFGAKMLRDNVDARTVEDVITANGYPYESFNIVTADGYVMKLERLPRRGEGKVVLLQHGIFDTAMPWVGGGINHSIAFACFDKGYDVFIGNFRGTGECKHMDAHKTGTEFWEFSMNDYAVHDMRAIVDEIHQLKAMELAERKRPDSPRSYSLTAVGHSMGGAVLMMYLVWMSLNGVPHHVSKAVLLSPAGFHSDIPLVPRIFLGSIGRLRSLVQHFIPAIYFPSPVMRTLASKFAQDVKNSPGLLELSSFLVCRLFIGGAAKDLPLKHTQFTTYNMAGAPYRVALHFSQLLRSKKFRMFDYGTPAQNLLAYGSAQPLDVGHMYHAIDVPCVFIAGEADRLVPPSMVREHHDHLAQYHPHLAAFLCLDHCAHLDFLYHPTGELIHQIVQQL